MKSTNYPIRINKYLRDNGLASRREVDKLIEDGLVLVNNKVIKKGFIVKEGDNVKVKGEKKNLQYLAYYKPRGLATQDLPGKESVITKWKEKGLYPIGRLDKESEGLLILTNDGRFAREVLLDTEKYEKEYIVTVKEPLRPGIIKIFESGMKTKSLGRLLPVKTKIINKTTLSMILKEGKRHQIRIMLDALSYNIISLKRIRIGNIKLENLKINETRIIK